MHLNYCTGIHIKKTSNTIVAKHLKEEDNIMLEDFPYQIKEIQRCYDPLRPINTILIKAIDYGLGLPLYDCLHPNQKLPKIEVEKRRY